MTFSALGLPEPILRGVRAVGYETPTPIQSRAIPLILPGHDLVAAAQTGSGKTAAFLLPILVRLLEGPRRLRALVLVPTRELAAQVESVARDYNRYARVRVGCVFGGVPIGPQERMLRHEGVELLVATPGRLLDLHGRQSVSLDEVEVLVLDEADRMVDMGFAPDLRRILSLLPKQRQTLMFSATMPPELNKVAKEALREPQRLEISPPTKPVETVEQVFFPVAKHLKTDLLHELLERTEPRGGVIVFTRTKHGADRLSRALQKRGHDVAVLHGDRSQGQRERAMKDFARGKVEILVATDIASRGIDVDDVTHVVNYDVPRTPEDYVHRIGRTGRMNATGDALTLVSPDERREAEDIERSIGRHIPRVRLEDFDYHKAAPPREAGHDRGGRGHGRAAHGHGGRGSHADGARSSHAGSTRSRAPAERSDGRRVGPSSSSDEASHGRRRRINNSQDKRNRKRM
jgi:ATP-dependent RNA helicase RhlE